MLQKSWGGKNQFREVEAINTRTSETEQESRAVHRERLLEDCRSLPQILDCALICTRVRGILEIVTAKEQEQFPGVHAGQGIVCVPTSHSRVVASYPGHWVQPLEESGLSSKDAKPRVKSSLDLPY